MLIRNIEDLRTLCDGDSGIPTVSNYPIIDKVLYRSKKFGLQMTNALKHISSVAKLPNMLNALGIGPFDHLCGTGRPPDMLRLPHESRWRINVPDYVSTRHQGCNRERGQEEA